MPILQTLGFFHTTPSSPITNLASPLLITNLLFTYILSNTRWPKMYYGLDHNSCPRIDLEKYGEEAVKSGKIDRKSMERLRRWEGAHANNLEAFPVFVGTLLFALHSGLPVASVNRFAAIWTVFRIGYTASYINIETENGSFLRSALWMAGNGLVVWTLAQCGTQLNSAVPVLIV